MEYTPTALYLQEDKMSTKRIFRQNVNKVNISMLSILIAAKVLHTTKYLTFNHTTMYSGVLRRFGWLTYDVKAVIDDAHEDGVFPPRAKDLLSNQIKP